MELNELTRERLTDDRTYKEVKDVAEGLTRAGRLPACDLLRYIKLAEYEQAENNKEEVAAMNKAETIDEVVHEILEDSDYKKEHRENHIMINIVVNGKHDPYYSILYYDKRDGHFYEGFGTKNYKIVKAYQKAYFAQIDPEFAEKRSLKLEDKHWNECRQIALYQNELSQALDLLSECYGALNALGKLAPSLPRDVQDYVEGLCVRIDSLREESARTTEVPDDE